MTKAQKGALVMVASMGLAVGGLYYSALFIPAFALCGVGVYLWFTSTDEEINRLCECVGESHSYSAAPRMESPSPYAPRPQHDISPPPMIFSVAPSAPPKEPEPIVVVEIRPRKDSGA